MVDSDWPGLGHVTILGTRNAISSSYITWTKSGRRADVQRKIRALMQKKRGGGMGNKQVKATDIQHSYKSEVLKFYFINFNICRVYRLQFMELIKSYIQTGRDGTDCLLTQVL